MAGTVTDPVPSPAAAPVFFVALFTPTPKAARRVLLRVLHRPDQQRPHAESVPERDAPLGTYTFSGFRGSVAKSAPLRSRLCHGHDVFANSYGAATVRERSLGTDFPEIA